MTEVNEDSMIPCAVCSTDIDIDDAHTTERDDIVCDDCVRTCECCYEIGTTNDIHSYVDGDLWCESCTNREGNWCESCDEYTRNATNYIADRDTYWCDDCSSDTFYCEDCSSYFYQGYCESCPDARLIHDYGYRPDPIFHSTEGRERLYFGLEIEVEAGRNYSDAATYAHQLEDMELAYLKSDGSLNCGFEVVTHPMSHDFIKNEAEDFFNVITGLRNQHQVKSWGTSTCGVHIHISRTGFNGGAHMHRFLKLVYSNQDFYETMAGRSSDRWAKFDDVKHSEFLGRDEDGARMYKQFNSYRSKLIEGNHTDRYSAVNTQNRATLEMRIFKGTTNVNTIKSYVDLAHASVEYTRTISVREVSNGALEVEPFLQYIVDNSELYPELVERINRLYIDIVRLNGQEVSA